MKDKADIDEYGVYGDISIAGVTQRFRWIKPGSFLMGSLLDEPERRNKEVQHPVTLTKGFWLADTACTQELWEAVTGENPSRFKGVIRPVEMVNWYDCVDFIKKINKQTHGMPFRLPTEAEWEYCCRAGTTTPFSFGCQIDTEQVNYNGNFPYNNGKKGKNRRETVEVKSMPPNPWGLYEMHGNVCEWCSDWYGEYQSYSVTDPTGPGYDWRRVLRGGGWVNDGRFVRSACRYMIMPVFRGGVTGFRLARD